MTGCWSFECTTSSPDGTRRLAGDLADACRPGDVVLLAGGLGAGKTTFAQGFAARLGVQGPVTSPTFTLVREYPCSGTGPLRRLLHADIYRLETVGEVLDLDLAELVDDPSGAVALVEWGDGAAPAFPGDLLTVTLRADPTAGDELRRVTVAGRGSGWVQRLQAVAEGCGGGR